MANLMPVDHVPFVSLLTWWHGVTCNGTKGEFRVVRCQWQK